MKLYNPFTLPLSETLIVSIIIVGMALFGVSVMLAPLSTIGLIVLAAVYRLGKAIFKGE